MARFRKLIFWLHLIVAVSAGLIILTMSVTGVLLTYEKRITYWSETRGMDGGPPQTGGRPLPTSQLLERVQAARAPAPTALRWRSTADAPVEVMVGREGTLYVNRYTGAVLGEVGGQGTRAFFAKVTELHRYLGASGERRDTGKAITGAANLGFLFLALSGFYLWFPRNWSKRAFANVTRFRRGLSPKARDFNWHNVIGFWSLVPLIIIISSGAMISYVWINDLMYRTVGDTPPSQQPAAAPAADDRAAQTPVAPSPETWDALLARVQDEVPDWTSINIPLKATENGLAATAERGQLGQIQKRVQLTADPRTLEFTRIETFADHSPGRRARLTLRYLHTGEWFGIAGQTVAGVVSAGILVMIWTGISLALRRLWAWRRRRPPIP